MATGNVVSQLVAEVSAGGGDQRISQLVAEVSAGGGNQRVSQLVVEVASQGPVATKATIAGVGTLAAVGRSVKASVFSSSGTGALSIGGRSIRSATFSSAGLGAAGDIGSSTRGGILTSSGIGALSAVGRSTRAAPFTSAGVGAYSPVGRSTRAAPFTSAGVGGTAFVGANVITGTGAFVASAPSLDGTGAELTGNIISQLVAEVSSGGSGNQRISQLVAEVSSGGSGNQRVSQLAVEVAAHFSAPQAISQLVVEVAAASVSGQRISQLVAEVAAQNVTIHSAVGVSFGASMALVAEAAVDVVSMSVTFGARPQLGSSRLGLTLVQGLFCDPRGNVITHGTLVIRPTKQVVDGVTLVGTAPVYVVIPDTGLLFFYLFPSHGVPYDVQYDPTPEDTVTPIARKSGYLHDRWHIPATSVVNITEL